MKQIFFLLYFVVSAITLQAQESTSTMAAEIDVPISLEYGNKTPLKTTQQNIAESYGQFYKRLPVNFSGYTIELVQSDRPLAREHDIFQQFGNIYYDKLEDGNYVYCITADNFSSVASLKRYVENMIQHRAPNATIVEYKNGKRKNKAKDKNCCPGLERL